MNNLLIIPILLALVLVAGGLGVALFYLLRWLLSELAERNILVTFRTEGEFKAIMKGDKCHRWIMSVENHLIDPDDHDVFKGYIPDEEDAKKGAVANMKDYILYLRRQAAELEKTDPTFSEQKLVEVTDANRSQFVEVNADIVKDPGNGKEYAIKPDLRSRIIEENTETLFEKWFGVVWVGLPPYSVFTYKFRWIKYAQEEAGADGRPSDRIKMTPRDETVDSLYFRYPVYGIVMDDAETGAGELGKSRGGEGKEVQVLERIQVRLNLVMETRTRNPQKTLFRTAGLSSAGEWLSAISKEIRHAARIWVGEHDYDYFVKSGAKESVKADLNRIRNEVNQGIETKDDRGATGRTISSIADYGQEIVSLDLVDISLVDETLQTAIDEIFKAEQALRKADKESARLKKLAEGRRAETAAPYLGAADGMEKIAAIPDGAGTKMRVAESIGAGGIRVLQVGGGSGQMLSLPESIIGGDNPKSEKSGEETKPDKTEEPPGDKGHKKRK